MGIQTYNLIRALLSQERRTGIKKCWGHVHSRLAPIRQWLHGQFGAEDLGRELESKIGDQFEVLMVHCSSGSLHPMFTGTVSDLLDMLLGICGPRTLAMPAFFFGSPIGCHNAVEFYTARPEFNSRTSVSQTGILSELFRRRKGVLRSLHPTHSVCAHGPLSADLVAGHHDCDTTFGEGTPFGIMAGLKTVILGIGLPYYRCLTQMHAPEDLLGERFPIQVYNRRLSISLIDRQAQTHGYRLRVHKDGLRRNLGLLRELLNKMELQEWSYHGVPMFSTTARLVTGALTDAAWRGKSIYGRAPR